MSKQMGQSGNVGGAFRRKESDRSDALRCGNPLEGLWKHSIRPPPSVSRGLISPSLICITKYLAEQLMGRKGVICGP